MTLVRQSLRTRPPFGELGDPPLPSHGTVLFEEEYCRQPVTQHVEVPPNTERIEVQSKREKAPKQNDVKRILKTSSREELSYADHVERLLIEKSLDKQRRRQSSVISGANSYHVDKFLHDENNDWFFEKILEKFENLRSKKSNHLMKSSSNTSNSNATRAVERIVERRYYVKKPPLIPKRDQLTSTSDLTGAGKKNRVLSGVSTDTTRTASCSRCSSSTPTFVENLRDQSNSLIHEIGEIKNEIEQLQMSQQEFFAQLRSQIQLKPADSATIRPNFGQTNNSSVRPSIERSEQYGNQPLPINNNQRSRTVSSASSTTTTTTSAATSGTTTPTPSTAVKPATTLPIAPSLPITEFVATKNPSYAPTPSVNSFVTSKPPIAPTPPANLSGNSRPSPAAPTPPFNPSVNFKPPSAAPTPSVNSAPNSKPPSIAPTSPANRYISSKPSSIAPTPPNNPSGGAQSSIPSLSSINELAGTKKPIVTSGSTGSTDSRHSTPTPTPLKNSSPKSSTYMSPYENELAHRRTLSPRSQIVASSASVLESSTSSSQSTSPTPIQTNPSRVPKVATSPLRDNDLKDLVHYSSQLELSGFPPSTTHVITNPNTSSTFWDSVEEYIETSKVTNTFSDIPSIPRSYYGNSYRINDTTTKQLDKYNLEIKPQDPMTSSAPLLMPPLDTSP